MGLTLLAIVLSGITVGPADITWRDTASALLAGIARLLDRIDGLPITEAVSWQDTIIWQVRLPRVLVAVFVGAALATSGAVLQGLFRNPLASSDTLGVSSGASLGGVLAIYLGLTTTTIWALPILAFVGATLSLLLVYSIASERGQAPVATLLLAGIAVGSLNVAASSLVQALALEKWEVGSGQIHRLLEYGGLGSPHLAPCGADCSAANDRPARNFGALPRTRHSPRWRNTSRCRGRQHHQNPSHFAGDGLPAHCRFCVRCRRGWLRRFGRAAHCAFGNGASSPPPHSTVRLGRRTHAGRCRLGFTRRLGRQ